MTGKAPGKKTAKPSDQEAINIPNQETIEFFAHKAAQTVDELQRRRDQIWRAVVSAVFVVLTFIGFFSYNNIRQGMVNQTTADVSQRIASSIDQRIDTRLEDIKALLLKEVALLSEQQKSEFGKIAEEALSEELEKISSQVRIIELENYVSEFVLQESYTKLDVDRVVEQFENSLGHAHRYGNRMANLSYRVLDEGFLPVLDGTSYVRYYAFYSESGLQDVPKLHCQAAMFLNLVAELEAATALTRSLAIRSVSSCGDTNGEIVNKLAKAIGQTDKKKFDEAAKIAGELLQYSTRERAPMFRQLSEISNFGSDVGSRWWPLIEQFACRNPKLELVGYDADFVPNIAAGDCQFE